MESVNNMMIDTHNLLREKFKTLDFEKEIGSVLKKLGYVYDLNLQTGDFKIIAAPGCYVKARRDHEHYVITVEMNYNGFSASASDKTWVDDRGLNDLPLLISPFGLENYKFIFDKLIASLQEEYARYETMNKGDKGAKLISNLIWPVLRKLKLSGVKIDRCDGNPGYFWLIKQLFGNASLRVKVCFNDYEEGCYRLAAAIKRKPSCVLDNGEMDYNRDAPYHNDKPLTNHGRGRGLVKTMEDAKMVYNPSMMALEHNSQTDSEMTKVLSDMGYVFSKDNQLYTIYINSDTVIQKNNKNQLWLKDLSSGLVTDNICMDNDEFVYLLKLIAVGTAALDGYNYFYWKKNVWYSFLSDIISVMLPTSFRLYHVQYLDKSFFVISNGNESRTIDTDTPQLMQSLYKIIEILIAGKKLSSDIEKNLVEVYIDHTK